MAQHLCDRDVLDGVLMHLLGSEALALASTCQLFARALSSIEGDALWEHFYKAEFGAHGFSFHRSVRWSHRYRVAHQRIRVRHPVWYNNVSAHEMPHARQGAAGCALRIRGGNGFCVHGGWTDAVGITDDVHVLRKVVGESVWGWQRIR